MFESAGKFVDSMFVGFRNYLDKKLVPTWRVWWKLASMRLGVLAAAIATYLTAVPQALSQAMNALPDWLHHSLPDWIGPVMLAGLFFARFWDQTHTVKGPPAEPTHGAE